MTFDQWYQQKKVSEDNSFEQWYQKKQENELAQEHKTRLDQYAADEDMQEHSFADYAPGYVLNTYFGKQDEPQSHIMSHGGGGEADAWNEAWRKYNASGMQELIDEYERKYQDPTMQYEDSFWGQFDANRVLSRISIDTDYAYSKYAKDPTEENRKRAEAMRTVMYRFINRNSEALDDENVEAAWLSKTAASYIPQLVEQVKYGGSGAAAGAAGGAAIGSGVTAATGGVGVPSIPAFAIYGAKTGYVGGTAVQGYKSMQGQALRELLEAGYDYDTALEMANDEAFVNALIEGGESILDVATLGTGSLAKGGAKKAGKELLEGGAKKAGKELLEGGVKKAGKVGLDIARNVGSEAIEEGLQQSVSYANRNRDTTGKVDLAVQAGKTLWNAGTGKNPEAAAEIMTSAGEGAKIALMFGTAKRIGAYGVNRAINSAYNSRVGKKYASYGDDVVDAIIDTGLESEPGTKSRSLAEKLSGKREKGKTISNREIGDILRANVRAIQMENEKADAVDEGSSESTAHMIAKTATEESGDTDVPYNAMGIDNPARRAAMRNSDTTTTEMPSEVGTKWQMQQDANPASKVHTDRTIGESILGRYSDNFGAEGKKNLTEFYDGRVDAPSYYAGYTAYYEAGVNGVEMDAVKTPFADNLTDNQKLAAYTAGKIDQHRGEAVASTSETSYTDTIETGGDIHGEEVHLRNGGQWTDSAYPGGAVSAVEESAGRDPSRNTESIGADRETAALTYDKKKVSTSALGIKGGSKKKTIHIVTGGDTTATREAKRIAKERGLDLILFAGDNLHINERGHGVSARAYIVGNKAYVRVDHPDFNSAQLMGHEEGHNKIARGEIDPDAVRERIEQVMGKGKAAAASRMYAEAYEGSGLTAEEIWEEVICDANGNMNIFAETMNEAQAGEYLEQVRSAVDAETAKGRAPPATDKKTNGKMSREYWRTDLTKTQYSALMNWVKRDIETSDNRICETANWTYHEFREFGGLPVFAIYSTENQSEPTVLYEVKGEQAKFERGYLEIYLEELNYGRNIDQKSEAINEVLGGSWVRHPGRTSDHNRTVGRGRSSGDAGVLQKSSRRKPRAAFKSVLRNLFENSKNGRERGSVTDQGALAEGKMSRELSYSGKNVEWAVERGVITEADRIAFFRMIANINKLGDKVRRTSYGGYIVELHNKLLFTDGDWHSPTLSAVITFFDNSETSMSIAKEVIFNGKHDETGYEQARQIIESAYWPGYVERYTERDRSSYGRENAGGEGGNSRRDYGEVWDKVTEGEDDYSPDYAHWRNALKDNTVSAADEEIGKMSRDLNRRQRDFFKYFDGGISSDLGMTGLEKKIVSSAIKSGDAVLNAKGTDGYVQSSDGNIQYFYVFTKDGHGVTITDILDYVLDEDAIEIVRRRTHDGTAKSSERSDRKAGRDGDGQQFGLHYDFAAEEADQSKGDAGVSGKESGGNTRGNHGESSGDYSDGGSNLATSERNALEDGDSRASRELTVIDRMREEYRALLERYGEIPKGENPYREAHVPKKTAKDLYVSETIRTVLEAKATPDAAVPKLEELIEDGVFSYERYTDKAAMEEAEAEIKDKGYSQALADWMLDMQKGVVSKTNTEIGWALYNEAANAKDLKTAMSILTNMVEHQRNAAQAVQASRILKKMSPDAQLYGIQRSVSNLQKELKERYGKRAPDLVIDETLARRFLEAGTDKAREDAMNAIYKDIGKQVPSRFIDKWNAWRYLSMLGNLRTHVRNVAGNAFFAPVVATKNMAATAIETAFGRRIERTKSFLGGKADAALLKAAWDDFENVRSQIQGEGKYSDLSYANRQIENGRQIFKFKPLEAARKGNSKMLDLEDTWFSRPHYANALAQYCKVNNLTAERIQSGKFIDRARAYAIKEAQKATYRDLNVFSDLFGRRFSEKGRFGKVGKAANTVMEGILPFRKTPANILARGIEYSPLGLLKGLTYDLVRMSKGELTAAEAIDNISAGLTGTGLMALGYALASLGLVRGSGGDDEKEKEFAELQGHQSYALELPNGTSITLDWLAPEALPLFVGVNLCETKLRNDGDPLQMADYLGAISNVTEPILEMSCLQGLNDMFDSIGYATSEETSPLMGVLAAAATSYLSQGIPTIFGQIERVTEKVRMTTYTSKNAWLTSDAQYAIGKASTKLPGDYAQVPYIDAWGRTEETGALGERMFNSFVNPAYTSQIVVSPMERELERLYVAVGDGSVFPSRAPKYFNVDGERIDLTAKEYVKYATQRGQISYTVVSAMVDTAEYQNVDDGYRVEAVSKAYEYANAVAKMEVSDYAPEGWVAKAIDTCKQHKVPVEQYIMAYVLQSDIESLKDENDETIPNSLGLQIMEQVYSMDGLTASQREALFSDFGVGKKVIGYSNREVRNELKKMR